MYCHHMRVTAEMQSKFDGLKLSTTSHYFQKGNWSPCLYLYFLKTIFMDSLLTMADENLPAREPMNKKSESNKLYFQFQIRNIRRAMVVIREVTRQLCLCIDIDMLLYKQIGFLNIERRWFQKEREGNSNFN